MKSSLKIRQKIIFIFTVLLVISTVDNTISIAYASGGLKGVFVSGIYKKLKARQYDKAIQKCERMRKMHMYGDEACFLEGLAYYLKKNYPMAVELFTKSIQLNGARGDAYYFLADANLQLKKPEEALRNINLAIDNRNTPALLATLNKPLGYSPLETVTRASMYWLRCRIYLNHHNEKAAFEDVNRAISISPIAYSGWYYLRGQLYLVQKKYVPSLKDFQKTVKLAPKTIDAWIRIGMIHFYLGDYKEDVESCKKLLQLDPDNKFVRGNLALAYWLAGDHKTGMDWMKKAIEKGDYPGSYYHIAYFFHVNGDQDSALINFKKAHELKPDILKLRETYLNMPPESSPTRKFYREEYKTAKMYIENGKTPKAIAYENRVPEISIIGLLVKPDPVPMNKAFDIEVSFQVDMPGNETEIPVLFSFVISRNNEVLFESKLSSIQADNRKPTHWSAHMNPVPVKGSYSIKGRLSYKKAVAEKTVSLTIN